MGMWEKEGDEYMERGRRHLWGGIGETALGGES
jgi:hypothetical protein